MKPSKHPANKQQHNRSEDNPGESASLKNLTKKNPMGKTLDKEKRVQPSPGTPIMIKTRAWNLPLFKQQTRPGSQVLELEIPNLIVAKTNELIKEAVPRMVNDAVKQDRESSTSIVPELISREFYVYAPKIIEELFKIHMKNTVLNVHPTISTSTATTTIADLQQQLYLTMKSDLQV
ncbi:hypothetical protein Tco_1009950 [Tanacetum coccineum]